MAMVLHNVIGQPCGFFMVCTEKKLLFVFVACLLFVMSGCCMAFCFITSIFTSLMYVHDWLIHLCTLQFFMHCFPSTICFFSALCVLVWTLLLNNCVIVCYYICFCFLFKRIKYSYCFTNYKDIKSFNFLGISDQTFGPLCIEET